MKQKLLLWDIDGTLIWGGGGGERALICAMKQVFSVDADLTQIDYAGRTDKLIGLMLMEHYGVESNADNLHNFVEAYLEHLAIEIHAGETKIHPGILPILDQVNAREDLLQGLLTGNMIRGAEIKLNHFSLWHYFEFGAFADDSALRNEIAPHALRRAIEKANYEFPPEDVFVIGDTPHDIECGKIIGAQTIAVATGNFSAQELAAYQPSKVFEDLSDSAAFFDFIDRPACVLCN